MDVLGTRGLATLRGILLFSLVSTALHYTHNVVRAVDYPQFEGIPVGVTQIVVAFSWVLFTAFGVLGYRDYVAGRYPRALAFLLVYSLSGLASAGHFLVGVPHVPVFWFATIVTDAIAALVLWVFVVWTWSVFNRVTARDQVSTQH